MYATSSKEPKEHTMWLSLTDPSGDTIAINSDNIIALRPAPGGTTLHFFGLNPNAAIIQVTQAITDILSMLGGS